MRTWAENRADILAEDARRMVGADYVTPAMVEAGVKVAEGLAITDEFELLNAEEIVAAIYRAMREAKR